MSPSNSTAILHGFSSLKVTEFLLIRGNILKLLGRILQLLKEPLSFVTLTVTWPEKEKLLHEVVSLRFERHLALLTYTNVYFFPPCMTWTEYSSHADIPEGPG
jgi:hypothetical protein